MRRNNIKIMQSNHAKIMRRNTAEDHVKKLHKGTAQRNHAITIIITYSSVSGRIRIRHRCIFVPWVPVR